LIEATVEVFVAFGIAAAFFDEIYNLTAEVLEKEK
jgi:hypothetical protein